MGSPHFILQTLRTILTWRHLLNDFVIVSFVQHAAARDCNSRIILIAYVLKSLWLWIRFHYKIIADMADVVARFHFEIRIRSLEIRLIRQLK